MDHSERERYSRQILLPGIGERGQERLLGSHAVIAGCGALGSFQAGALARAGVGRITIIDRDYVETSNLHRQWLFEESDAADALPTCETSGILNVIVSAVASFQVAAALRILSGTPGDLRAHITTLDLWDGGIRQIEAPPRDPECPTCARGEFPYLAEVSRPPVILCGRNAVQIHERARPIGLPELRARLEPL